MKALKRLMAALVVLLVLATGVALDYLLPRHEVVLVTGVEVKRVDDDGVINAENPADGPTRDVYYINTEHPDTHEVMVYRNEDTGWGFPWYFKFDSADVQARAQGFSRDSKQLALIRHYGWRIQILSVFPNLVSVEATDSRDEPFAVFNTLFLAVLTLLVLFVAWRLSRLVRSRRATSGTTVVP
ncbi:MAG: DUF1523 family protein [Pseudomonas sp.]|uniref:DUF1523 family protein n=1 Tax=Pseudomonas sp. TaxID=306 RepID=UPI003395219C